MKKKIVGIVVLVLVVTTVVSATNNLKMKENSQPKICGINIPVWKAGDSWIYTYHDTEYAYLSNHTRYYTLNHNCTVTLTITAVSDTNYTEKWTSTNNEGRIILGKHQMKFTSFTKLFGEDIFRKTDLSVWSESQQEKGLALLLMGSSGFPMPVRFLHEFKTICKDPFIFEPFPMNASTNGTFPGCRHSYQEIFSLDWIILPFGTPIKQNYESTPKNYTVEMANVTVPAGTYNAYNVSVDTIYGAGHSHTWRYYYAEVGNDVKDYFYSDSDNYGNPGVIETMELVSTTYTP